VHNEFFSWRWANHAMSMLNSIALCFPQSVFREHHLNHHRYNNQPPRPGQKGDLSSLYRYSRHPGEPEPFLRYALLSPLRADVLRYAQAAWRGGQRGRLVMDTVTVAAVMVFFAWQLPEYVVLYYLPLMYFGHAVTYAEGYFEHNRAVPGDRYRNAVSCYSGWYNFIWFNNGYHQEHHCYPALHWTRIAGMRARMVPEDQRRVVPHTHWVNF
jgi:fatty acid desaturase